MRSIFPRSKKSLSSISSAPPTEPEPALAFPGSDKMLAAVEPFPRTAYPTPTPTPSPPRHYGSLPGSGSSSSPNPMTPTLRGPGLATPSSSSTGTSNARCKKCPSEGVVEITKSSNRKGNAGRPYRKCPQHGFMRWLDGSGVLADNPRCHCGASSRRNVSGVEKGRRVYFECAEGECGFWETDKRIDGQDWCVNEDIVEVLRRVHLI